MNDKTVGNKALPPRRFVLNEEAVYRAAQKLPYDFIAAGWLGAKKILSTRGGDYETHLKLLEIPFERAQARSSTQQWFAIRKEDVLTALGRTPFVRPQLITQQSFIGKTSQIWAMNHNLPFRLVGKVIWIPRDAALRYGDSLQEKAAPAPAPIPAAQVPMPLTPDASDLLNCLDELKSQQEKLNAAQAILFKEVQCIRKGMTLILRDLIGAEKCESMQL